MRKRKYILETCCLNLTNLQIVYCRGDRPGDETLDRLLSEEVVLIMIIIVYKSKLD